MKKLLSMLLALTLVVSLFCAVPVSAEESTEFTLPYVNYDFNDIEDNATSNYGDSIGTWNAKEYIEGVAGGKALYRESTAVSSGSAYLQYTLSNGTPAVMASGEQFKISFWLKLNTDKTRFADNSTPSQLQLCYTANGGGKGYKAFNFSAQTAALNTGEWVYYEQTFAGWDGKNTVSGTQYDTVTNPDGAALVMNFRLGYVNGTGPAGVLASGYNTTYAIAIDDFRIEPVRTPYDPNNTVEPPYVPKEVLNFSFDNSGTTGYGINTWNVNSATKAVQTSGGADGGKYVKVSWSTAGGGVWRMNTWTHNQELDDNKLTKLTFWAKAEDANTVGSAFRFTMFRTMNNSNQPLRLDDINTYKSDIWPNNYWYIEVPGTLTQSWQQFTLYFKMNAKTFDESHYRVSLDIKTPNTGFAFGLDNMIITQEEIPTNGEFENLGYAPAQTVKSNGDVLANEQSKHYAANLYGWLKEGATVTADTTAPHGGLQAAKVVTTEAGGSPYQGIYLENNKTHEISFWAKGEGDSIGKNIAVVLDRAVATKSQYDVYPIEDTVTLTPTDATLTGEWKKFTVQYTLNSVAPETMPTINANQKIGVRQPFLKFAVDGGAAGMTYYLDDLKIAEPKTGHPEPYVTDYDMVEKSDLSAVTSAIEGKPVYIQYSPATEASGDSVEAVVTRVMIESKAGSGKYGTYKTIIDTDVSGQQEFTIPEGFAGRKIMISVQPFSANGKIGAHYEKLIGTIAKQYEASMTAGAYNSASSSFTTTYSVLNNKLDGSDVRAIMFAMFFAENGTMVKCESTPVVVANGNTGSGTFTATSTVSDTNLPAATKAKVFFWFTEGTDTPSVFNTSMVEVVPMQEVSLQ